MGIALFSAIVLQIDRLYQFFPWLYRRYGCAALRSFGGECFDSDSNACGKGRSIFLTVVCAIALSPAFSTTSLFKN
ncbi:MAG: hypothetical protein HC840_07455 [Leptolyngbyaceae cyanobacterium RM2_2_4]|nr:hypothetical protein [Leptolyngbyaceae cyanobacterium SL_5_14]NJO49306.1 hypothetical protein [Leptolyngbyaceae cyanobacterium RM2_2_4]